MAPMTPKAKQRFQRNGIPELLASKLESQIKGLVNSEAFFFYAERGMNTTCAVKLNNDHTNQISRPSAQ
jgi:hypothetical protein